MSAVIGDPRKAGESGPAGDQREAGEEGVAGDPRAAGRKTFTESDEAKAEDKAPAKTAKKAAAKKS